MLRSLSIAALAVAAVACRPDLPQTPPTTFVTAVFDPTAAKVPLPNDLALPPFTAANSACPPPGNTATGAPACAQAELLTGFQNGFPSDQELPITIDFAQTSFAADGTATQAAPDLDLATFTPSTFFVVATSGAAQGEVPIEPFTDTSYVKSSDHGTLTIHHQGRTPWAPGSYAVLVRGGAEGVATTDGLAVNPSQIFSLIAQGQDMTDPKNLGLLRAQTGSIEAARAQGTQLNIVIGVYKRQAFPAADTRFPHQELAILTTFQIAPTVTNVTIDPARGLVPLPIDLLRDPAKGTLTPLAACTLAGSSLAADGSCPSPAAAGFRALDGFSTTGAILAPTSELVQAATVTASSLMLFDLSDPAHPLQVSAASLILEPCEFTSSCSSPTALSPVIAIQPAGATSSDNTSVFRTRPLKDSTDYAIVMTTDIKDKAGRSIGPGTVASVLRFTNPIIKDGKSALLGIDDATAAALDKMRLQLQPVFATLAAANPAVPRAKVAMAYTFRTQSITAPAVGLAALPYAAPAASALPINASFSAMTPDDAFTKYGVIKGTTTGTVPNDNIDEVIDVDIVTFNALDPLTGAFIPDPRQAVPETIHALIATPKVANASVPACTGGLTPLGKCAPMMVFRHGLGRGRADMLNVADSFAAAGMVTVAIDAAKHGDRAFCTSGTTGPTGGCNPGIACVTSLPAGAQGDAAPPGKCTDGKLFKLGVNPAATGNTDGIPVISANYLVSANFFRTRDTFRQDLIDESQLVRALAFVPPEPAGVHHVVFEHMAGKGLIIDPATIYYSGQSLGAIQGVMDVATNPRIKKAVFNVGGGTIVDIFTNSPAFAADTDRLLAGLGIVRGTAQFLQFLVVAKTVLDPADPINFAGHLTDHTLPDLLANPMGGTLQAPKKILAQMANCDAVVPNPFGFVYASNIPTGPLPPSGAPGTFQLFVTLTPGPCPGGGVEHGFLTDWTAPGLTALAQRDLANFVRNDTAPPSIQHE
ncbi:MAG TPA: hypothetical protein VFD36_30175 [Kofleriaceae bacterium]|nr:hypothetical protein [Kofleriaceae bacterium]